jgi:hypothetical protein
MRDRRQRIGQQQQVDQNLAALDNRRRTDLSVTRI